VTPPEVAIEAAPEIDLTDLSRRRDGFPHRLFGLKSLPVRAVAR